MPQPMLEVKNLAKSFGSTEVLRGISFSLGEGEALVIIGSSGSGKNHAPALPELPRNC